MGIIYIEIYIFEKSFKKNADDVMPSIISNIINDFSVQLRKLLGNGLSKVIIYGSYARDDFKRI